MEEASLETEKPLCRDRVRTSLGVIPLGAEEAGESPIVDQ